jgi:DNA-binding MarR family transcriptional regulator
MASMGSSFAVDPDRVIHEPARLKIMSVLSVLDCADFIYLMNETGLTRGNLSVQLRRLEAAGYLAVSKEFKGRIPRTIATMTDAGRKAFREYRAYLRKLLRATSEQDVQVDAVPDSI